MRAAARRLSAAAQGLPAETVALLFTLGLVLGTFPVFGFPTILCALAALAFRLNLPALQLVNQLASPLQIALLAPLARVGSHLVGAPASSAIAFKLGAVALDAAAGWCAICLPLGIALYFTLLHVLRRCRPHCFHLQQSPA